MFSALWFFNFCFDNLISVMDLFMLAFLLVTLCILPVMCFVWLVRVFVPVQFVV